MPAQKWMIGLALILKETSHVWVHYYSSCVISVEQGPTPLAAAGHVVCSCEQHGESPDGMDGFCIKDIGLA